MKKLISLVAVAMILGGIPLFAQDVRYNFDKEKDFSKYRTYKWVPIDSPDKDKVSDLVLRQLTAAIDTDLATKGMMKTEADNADLYIGFQTAINTEKEFTSYNTGWGYGPGWGGGWYGYGGGMATSTTYGSTSTVNIGQLDLSMYDPVGKQLVWRGTVSKTIDPKAKADKVQKNITKAVQKLLKTYPPQPKK